jgi:hypothetical protein
MSKQKVPKKRLPLDECHHVASGSVPEHECLTAWCELADRKTNASHAKAQRKTRYELIFFVLLCGFAPFREILIGYRRRAGRPLDLCLVPRFGASAAGRTAPLPNTLPCSQSLR